MINFAKGRIAIFQHKKPTVMWIAASTLLFFVVISPHTAFAACTGTALGSASASDPATATIAPGSAITNADAFTFQSSGGGCSGDTVTALTISLANSGTPYNGLAEVRITNSAGTTQYFTSVTTFSSNTVNFSGGTSLPVTNTIATFKIRITPLSHALMPAPPGASYAFTATTTGWTGTLSKSGTDSNANTIAIDNLSPAAATSLSAVGGGTKTTLGWTSTSGETSTSTILRWASSSAGAEVPAEGVAYAAGNTITTATVACVFAALTTATVKSNIIDGSGGTAGCTTSALITGQPYTYKIFQQDAYGNYNTGTTFNVTWSATRIMRLFNGYRIKLIGQRITIQQRQ